MESPSDNFGMGVIGKYPDEGIAMDEFLHLVCRALDVDAVRYSAEISIELNVWPYAAAPEFH